MSLDEQYHNDIGLLEFYRSKLLQPGWAGELTPDEFTYIKSQLKQSPSLKRRWGFRPSAKRLSEAHIRAMAMNGLSANERGISASLVGEERRAPIKVLGTDKETQTVDTKITTSMRLEGKKS